MSFRPSPTLSPLGALLAEMREEQMLRRSTAEERPAARQPRAFRSGLPEPELQLEAASGSRPRASRLVTYGLLLSSVSLHAGLLLAAVVVPLLRAEPLPSPASATKAFFVVPVSAAPPPPPPATRADAGRQAKNRVTSSPSPTLTAPVETPDQVKPEEILDIGLPERQPGGVEGGVGRGGSGVVIDLPPAPSPPRPPERVGINVKEPTKLKHVEPVYPDIAQRANVQGIVILECVISPAGRVTDVQVLRGTPLLDGAAIDAVKQWTFTPTLLEGVPVSVVMSVTVQFRLLDTRP